MSEPLSIFEDFQRDVYARILAHPPLADVAVFVIDPRDQNEAVKIQSAIDLALAVAGVAGRNSKAGAAILIPLPEITSPLGDTPGPVLQLAFGVRIMERPLINMGAASGTLLSANKIALYVLQLLHQWGRGSASTITAAQTGTIQKVTGFPKDDIAFDVHFEMQLALQPALKAQPPIIGAPSPDVAIIFPPGSSGRFTVIAPGQPITYPDSSATLYTAPITGPLASGTLIRAVAYDPPLHASNLSERLIP